MVLARLSRDVLACEIYEGVGDAPPIFYLEQWRSEVDLHCHIQSAIYVKLLAVMDMFAIKPEIHYCETRQIRGMELIESLRTQYGHGR